MRKVDGFVGKPKFYAVMAGIMTAAIVLTASPVAAQEEADSVPKTRSSLVIEEITVTARKKEENLQDVPMAITAFSAEELQRAGINNLADVAAFTPGLTFSSLFGEFLPVPVIRGVAPTAIFGENNGAVFVDGVFVAGREGLNASQLDLERIEVLKGPQSTQYGRNAFAGAINYVTARPGDELEVEARFRIGDYERREARISVSGPLVGDKLLGRIALGIDEWAGSYNNSLSNLDIGGYQYKTLQTSLWFTPTDTFDVQWALYLSDDEIDDSARRTVPANCEDREELELGNESTNFEPIAPSPIPDPENPPDGTRDNPDYSDGPRPQNFCGTLPTLPDNTLAINDQAVGEERELVRSSLTISWDVGWGSITSLTGFSNTKQSARSDSNQTPDGNVPYYYLLAGNERDIFPAELTTVSTLPVRFDIGGYWYDVEAFGGFTDFTARCSNCNGARLPDDFVGLFPAPTVVGDSIFGPRFTNTVDDLVSDGIGTETIIDNTQSWSVFGGLEFDMGDRWTADIGARYNQDEKRFRAFVNENIPGEEINVDETRDFNYWSWRTGLRFQATEDNMIYASISTGKKSGGMDLILGAVLAPQEDGSIEVEAVARVTDFDIEKLTAYELGNKGKIWDGRAQYDVAVFYNDWTDILMPQIIETDPVTGYQFEQPEGVDLTGGDATTYGIEMSLFVILTENWDINLGGAWTDATYDDAELLSLRLFPSLWSDSGGSGFGDPVPDGIGDSADISGNEMLRQSKWQGNFTLNYNKPIRNDWAFYSRTDVLYTGSQWVGAANQAKVPDFTDVNQRLGLENENFRLEFWVENLLDSDSPRAAFRDVTFNNTHLQLPAYGGFSDMFPFRMTVSHPIRRTVGVTAIVRF